ncbi:MAG: hypothetical protein GWO87_00650 [Xanthomonadaceae bacterium]|nr:hypothetical protein [Rhodospirillaceae bacterium]NIA17689.1 hypothetical protein [Xanthomonadaceae bacterium]
MKIISKKIFLVYIIVFSCIFVFFIPKTTVVQGAETKGWVNDVLGGPLIPDACLGKARDCGVAEFFQVLNNVFRLMLGLLGSLSLLFFVYGGFVWLLSRGNTNMIEKGKDIIIGSVIGLSIVLGSWVIINFIIAVFTGNLSDFGHVKIFNKEWWKFPK